MDIYWCVAVCTLCLGVVHGERCPFFFSTRITCSHGDVHTNKSPFRHMPLPCCPEDRDVEYMLYTRANTGGDRVSLNQQNVSSVGQDKSIFLVHGYTDNGHRQWLHDMKDALLSKEDFNVIIVNWANLADDLLYPQSASNVRTVGANIAAMMKKLVEDWSITWDNIWCVGHSLGSHACAHAGMRTPTKIGRITGLDPAGPWFENHSRDVGLNSDCADFVDVIHTDSGRNLFPLGLKRPCGHIDFYPNGIGIQPGCLNRRRRRRRDTIVACSHMRAVYYFTESIVSKEPCFIAKQKCTDVTTSIPESCTPCDICPVMGFDAKNGDNGIYYLQTSPWGIAPHCLG